MQNIRPHPNVDTNNIIHLPSNKNVLQRPHNSGYCVNSFSGSDEEKTEIIILSSLYLGVL